MNGHEEQSKIKDCNKGKSTGASKCTQVFG